MDRGSRHRGAVTEEAVTEAVTEEAVTEEAVTEEAVTEEAVTEEAVTEEAVVTEDKISPLIINTWFHSVDEAIHHPKAVSKLDIIHQETMENLDVLSRFPYLEELHFIKVNIDSFEELNSAPAFAISHLTPAKSVVGWGCWISRDWKKSAVIPMPPEKVKRLLEENGVEIYLFTPKHINGSKASNTVEPASETQMICEETLA